MSLSMHAPDSPTTISLSLVTELFSRFFARLLETESKYPIYLKEWESFRNVLTNKPLDLDAVYLHLATIQLNLEKVQSAVGSINDIPSIKILPAKPYDEYVDFKLPPKLNVNTSPRGRSSSEIKSRPSLPINLESQFKPSIFSTNSEANSRTQLSHRQYSDPYAKRNSINVDFIGRGDAKHHSLPISSFAEVAEMSSFMQSSDSYSDLKVDSQNHSQNLSGIDQILKTKYDLGFLASKARRFAETVEYNSNKVIKSAGKGKGVPGGYEMEERTPLRRIVVYSAQSPKQSTAGGNNNLQDALDQLAYKLQNNPKDLPFKNALISY